MSAFHLDLLGGMAGDMFVAALLDLRPDLEAGLHAVLSACPLLDGIDAALADHNDGVLSGQAVQGDEGERHEGLGHGTPPWTSSCP